MTNKQNKWPKKLPPLTKKEQHISDDFAKYWHAVLPKNKIYRLLESFNHRYPIKNSSYVTKVGRTLEIGAGTGNHIIYEDLSVTEYIAMELRPNMAEVIRTRFPKVKVIVSDCQRPMEFPDNYFDRVLAIHLLEHLPNLPATIKEVFRILKPGGEFCVVIPCEGGVVYSIARWLSAKRLFKKRYGVTYDWFIKREHINLPQEIINELSLLFIISKKTFFPLYLPSVNLNLAIGVILKKRITLK